ncbi:peptide MFS transporter [Iodidimonas sp. SYSU 1G8]|uniref:peptide MFS transporter n=1 Tax=Iodidimonas sp. SYSU 1G8 TaxID=3133967 RepID=UPI0031FEB200
MAAGTMEKTFLGHPRGLVILFLTEMWERFSYYGMRSILLFYLTRHFLFGDTPAYGIYSAYISLIYISPIIGGFVADRYLGFKRAILLGGILIACGHAGMAFEGAQATIDAAGTVARDGFALQILYLSLALIITGTGLLKANISSIVGSLYAEGDRRRDAGFTLFYMGINIGAFIASLTCAWLGETYGWSWGFGAAGIGMALGVVTFILGRGWLEGKGMPPDPVALERRVLGPMTLNQIVILGCVLMVLPVWLLVQNSVIVGGALGIAGGLAILAVVIYATMKLEPVARDRVFAILILMPFHSLFWAFFEQTGTSMALFADRGVELSLFGLAVAPGQIQAINPLCIILFAPVIAWIWLWLDRMGREPHIPLKFALGLLQIGLGFFVFVIGIEMTAQGDKVGLGWLAFGILLHSTGELCISPVGLSAVTKLSLARIGGLMMGVWFLSNAFANYGAGLIAMTASIEHAPGEEVDVVQALPIYGEMFYSVGWVAVGSAALLMVLSPLLRKLMHGVR